MPSLEQSLSCQKGVSALLLSIDIEFSKCLLTLLISFAKGIYFGKRDEKWPDDNGN
jgi:hypothetical protein